MGSSHILDQLDTCFDDTHAVANAGLLLPATLAERLGIEETADALIDLGEQAGAHRPGRKLLRWVAATGLGARGELVVAKTLCRTLLALPGRLIRSARRWIMHLPAGWPWAAWFELALARLAASPTPPDTTTGPRKLPRPDRASASLPKHAWPAARVLPIDPNRPRAARSRLQRTPTTAANRAPQPHQPTKNSGIGGSRLSPHPYQARALADDHRVDEQVHFGL
jgi:hypothetical protein